MPTGPKKTTNGKELAEHLISVGYLEEAKSPVPSRNPLYSLSLDHFSQKMLPECMKQYSGKPAELYGAAKAFMEYGIEKIAFTPRERKELQECIAELDAEKAAGGFSGSMDKVAKNIQKHLDTFCQTQLKEHHITSGEMVKIIQKIPPLDDDNDYAKRSYLMHAPKKRDLDPPHTLLAELITHHGGKVKRLQDDAYSHGLEVFTRDPLIVNHQKKEVYLPDFKGLTKNATHEASQREFQEYYKALGYKMVSVSLGIEGGDIQPYLSNKGERQGLWIASHLTRKDGELLRAFAEKQELDILILPQPISIETYVQGHGLVTNAVHPQFYHLDTFFSSLPNGEVLIYEPATTKEACEDLKKRVGKDNYISISEEDANHMATNLVSVGRTLIMPHCSKALQETLETRGYQIVSPQTLGLPENFFQFQYGASHCMTNELTQARPQGVTDDIAALAAQYGQDIKNAAEKPAVNNPLLAQRSTRSGPHSIA